jgi:hypothetical protein
MVMNRQVAWSLGALSLSLLALVGGCQGPDAYYRGHDGGAAGAHGGGGVIGTAGAQGGGGVTGAGGVRGTGGVTGAGGARGTGGATGSGGTPGTGGARGAGGAGGAGGGGGCIAAIIAGRYAFPPAAPCSACNDNGMSLADKCMGMIDCLTSCTSGNGNCQTNCLNSVGGSGVLATCVNNLTAACGP